MVDSHFWIACLIAAGVTASLIAVLRPLAEPLGLVDHPSDRKHHIGAVPLIGGLAMFGGTVSASYYYGDIGPFSMMVIETAAVMAVIGALDDRHELSVRVRLFAQIACVLCVVLLTRVYIKSLGHLFGNPIELGLAGIPFTVIAVIGLLNAFNMLDGIDGLAGSQSLVSVGTLILFDRSHNVHGITVLLSVMAAATVPYLLVNLGLTRHKIFLGDAGSMLVGYVLSWALIRIAQLPESHVSPTDVLWCVSVPVLDTLTVMGRRILEGKSPFKADRGHVHHMLLHRGFTPRGALLFLLGLSFTLSLLGSVTRQYSSGVSLMTFCAVAVTYAWISLREFRRQQEYGCPKLVIGKREHVAARPVTHPVKLRAEEDALVD